MNTTNRDSFTVFLPAHPSWPANTPPVVRNFPTEEKANDFASNHERAVIQKRSICPCEKCNGSGVGPIVWVNWSDGLGGIESQCEKCEGTGEQDAPTTMPEVGAIDANELDTSASIDPFQSEAQQLAQGKTAAEVKALAVTHQAAYMEAIETAAHYTERGTQKLAKEANRQAAKVLEVARELEAIAITRAADESQETAFVLWGDPDNDDDFTTAKVKVISREADLIEVVNETGERRYYVPRAVHPTAAAAIHWYKTVLVKMRPFAPFNRVLTLPVTPAQALAELATIETNPNHSAADHLTAYRLREHIATTAADKL